MNGGNKMLDIQICDSDITFDSIKTKKYYPKEYDTELQSSDLIILPSDDSEIIFPEITTDFYKFLIDSNLMHSSIAISDDNYRRVEKHCDWIELGVILLNIIVLPVAVNMISSFLYDRIKKLNKKDDEVMVDVQIIVEETKTKKSKKIIYKGPVNGIEETLEKTSEKVFDEKQ